MKDNRYKELDALRGIAALMVVFFHFTMNRPEAKLGFKLGTTGVDLFFMISGFVIFMSLSKVKSSLEFIINRVSRLYPTYWACVTFTFLVISLSAVFKNTQIPITQYLGNMTMFQFYFRINNLDGPYWTMIVEMIFYIGMLILFHFQLLKYLNKIGITVSVVLFSGAFLFNNSLVQQAMIYIPLLQFFPLFFAGIIFYKIFINEGSLLKNYSIIILCLLSQIQLYNFAGVSKIFINHFEYSIMLIIYFALFTFFVSGKLKFIVSKPTLFFGKISFALYLIHQFISIKIIIPFLTVQLNINFWIAALLISLPLVILLATYITFYIEIPMGKKIKEQLKATWTLPKVELNKI